MSAQRIPRSLVLGLLMLASAAIQAGEPREVGAVGIDRSQRFLFPSEHVGDELRIDVMLPMGYDAGDDRHRVVYITDSNYLFYAAAATQLAQATQELPSLILVGVGYDVPTIADTGKIRFRDLAPTCDKEYQRNWEVPDKWCQGTADAFVAFLERELKPFINGRYRTDPSDETLVGYSLGGIFALHVLFNHTDTFDRFIIGSPAIRWDDHMLFKAEAKYASAHDDLDKAVHISAGRLEGPLRIANVHTMYARLTSHDYPNLRIAVDVFDNETHMTGINATVMQGLFSVMGHDPVESD